MRTFMFVNLALLIWRACLFICCAGDLASGTLVADLGFEHSTTDSIENNARVTRRGREGSGSPLLLP